MIDIHTNKRIFHINSNEISIEGNNFKHGIFCNYFLRKMRCAMYFKFNTTFGIAPCIPTKKFGQNLRRKRIMADINPDTGGASFVMQVRKEEDNAGHRPRL